MYREHTVTQLPRPDMSAVWCWLRISIRVQGGAFGAAAARLPALTPAFGAPRLRRPRMKKRPQETRADFLAQDPKALTVCGYLAVAFPSAAQYPPGK